MSEDSKRQFIVTNKYYEDVLWGGRPFSFKHHFIFRGANFDPDFKTPFKAHIKLTFASRLVAGVHTCKQIVK